MHREDQLQATRWHSLQPYNLAHLSQVHEPQHVQGVREAGGYLEVERPLLLRRPRLEVQQEPLPHHHAQLAGALHSPIGPSG